MKCRRFGFYAPFSTVMVIDALDSCQSGETDFLQTNAAGKERKIIRDCQVLHYDQWLRRGGAPAARCKATDIDDGLEGGAAGGDIGGGGGDDAGVYGRTRRRNER